MYSGQSAKRRSSCRSKCVVRCKPSAIVEAMYRRILNCLLPLLLVTNCITGGGGFRFDAEDTFCGSETNYCERLIVTNNVAAQDSTPATPSSSSPSESTNHLSNADKSSNLSPIPIIIGGQTNSSSTVKNVASDDASTQNVEMSNNSLTLLHGIEPLTAPKPDTQTHSSSPSFARYGCHCDVFCSSYGDCCPDRKLFRHLWPEDNRKQPTEDQVDKPVQESNMAIPKPVEATQTSGDQIPIQPNASIPNPTAVENDKKDIPADKVDEIDPSPLTNPQVAPLIRKLQRTEFTCSSFAQPNEIQLNIYTVGHCAHDWISPQLFPVKTVASVSTDNKQSDQSNPSSSQFLSSSIRRYQQSIRRKCEQVVSPSADTFLSVPIFSIVTGLTYKNIFCAVCNQDVSSALPWSVESFCDHSTAPEQPPVEEEAELESGNTSTNNATANSNAPVNDANTTTAAGSSSSNETTSTSTGQPASPSTSNYTLPCADTRIHFKPPSMFHFRPCVPVAVHSCPANTPEHVSSLCRVTNEIMYGPQFGLLKNRHCAECNQLSLNEHRCEPIQAANTTTVNGFPVPFFLHHKPPKEPTFEGPDSAGQGGSTGADQTSSTTPVSTTTGPKTVTPTAPTTTAPFPQSAQLPQQGPAYSLILDIDFTKGGAVVGTKSRCPPNYVYDPWKKICRLITCDPDSMVMDNHCVSRSPRSTFSPAPVSSPLPPVTSPATTLSTNVLPVLPITVPANKTPATEEPDSPTGTPAPLPPTSPPPSSPSAASSLTWTVDNKSSNSTTQTMVSASHVTPPASIVEPKENSTLTRQNISSAVQTEGLPILNASADAMSSSTANRDNESVVTLPNKNKVTIFSQPLSESPVPVSVIPVPAILNQSTTSAPSAVTTTTRLMPIGTAGSTDSVNSSSSKSVSDLSSLPASSLTQSTNSGPLPPTTVSSAEDLPVTPSPKPPTSDNSASDHSSTIPITNGDTSTSSPPLPQSNLPAKVSLSSPIPPNTANSSATLHNPLKLTITCARLTFASNEYLRYANGSVRLPPEPHLYTVDEYVLDARTGRLSICAPDIDSQQHFSRKFTLLQQYLTVGGLSVSIVSLLINICACAVKWRQRSVAHVLILWLSGALLAAQLLFLFGVDRVQNPLLCHCVGVCMHYTFLCSFCITNVLMFDIFRAFSSLSQFSWSHRASGCRWRTKLLRYSIYGFLLPAAVVVAGVAFDRWAGSIDNQSTLTSQASTPSPINSMKPPVTMAAMAVTGTSTPTPSQQETDNLKTDRGEKVKVPVWKDATKPNDTKKEIPTPLDAAANVATTQSDSISSNNASVAATDKTLPITVQPLPYPSMAVTTMTSSTTATGSPVMAPPSMLERVVLALAPRYGYAVCWISNRISLLVLFAVPVALILLVNVIFYLITAHRISQLGKASKLIRQLSHLNRVEAKKMATSVALNSIVCQKRCNSFSPRVRQRNQRRARTTHCDHLNPLTRSTTTSLALLTTPTTTPTTNFVPHPISTKPRENKFKFSFRTSSLFKSKFRFQFSATPNFSPMNTLQPSSPASHQPIQLRRMYQTCQRNYHQKKQEQQSFFVLYVKLALMIGCTWMIGFVAAFANSSFLWCVFIICNSSQGFFILFAFNGHLLKRKFLLLCKACKSLLCRGRDWICAADFGDSHISSTLTGAGGHHHLIHYPPADDSAKFIVSIGEHRQEASTADMCFLDDRHTRSNRTMLKSNSESFELGNPPSRPLHSRRRINSHFDGVVPPKHHQLTLPSESGLGRWTPYPPPPSLVSSTGSESNGNWPNRLLQVASTPPTPPLRKNNVCRRQSDSRLICMSNSINME